MTDLMLKNLWLLLFFNINNSYYFYIYSRIYKYYYYNISSNICNKVKIFYTLNSSYSFYGFYNYFNQNNSF